MDNGTLALVLICVLVGAGVLLFLVRWAFSGYYYDHK